MNGPVAIEEGPTLTLPSAEGRETMMSRHRPNGWARPTPIQVGSAVKVPLPSPEGRVRVGHLRRPPLPLRDTPYAGDHRCAPGSCSRAPAR